MDFQFQIALLLPLLLALIVPSLSAPLETINPPSNHQTYIPHLGNVQGVPCPTYTNVSMYLGIRYGQKPGRFSPPVLYNDTFPFPAYQAISQPPKCPQVNTSAYDVISEDCLFLNIYAPVNATFASNAVRVFFHGGFFASGSASDPFSNGCASAALTNTTMVVVQSRLGPWGYLAHPSTYGESETTGNWGIMDQQLALRWIQKYIGAFGGNSSVMLFGQNTGATAAMLHYVSPQSINLFTSVIAESGAAITLKTQNTAYDSATYLADALGCPTDPQRQLACLRNATWQEMLAKVPRIKPMMRPQARQFYPIVDGFIIPMQPLDLITNGQFNTVPLMMGVNQDEGRRYIYQSFKNISEINQTDVQNFVSAILPGVNTEPVFVRYYVGLYNNAFEQLSDIWSDFFVGCPTFRSLTAVSTYIFPPLNPCKPPFFVAKNQPCIVPVNMYYFTHRSDCPPGVKFLGATSGRELVYTLSLGNEYTGCSLTRNETILAHQTTIAWGLMAKIQQPAFFNHTPWVMWTPSTQTAQVLDTDPGLNYQTVDYASKCSVFDGLAAAPTPPPRVPLLIPNSSAPVIPGFPLGVTLVSPPPPGPSVTTSKGASFSGGSSHLGQLIISLVAAGAVPLMLLLL